MTTTTTTNGGDQERVHEANLPWLTEERARRIARAAAELLHEPTRWIDRRKDSVQVLDDTAVRWQDSVDFRLRQGMPDIDDPAKRTGERLLGVPCFVLPKAPRDYMGFDLVDETGEALSLINRADNATISGEVLVALAARVLGDEPSPDVAGELRRIATASPADAKPLVARRLDPLDGDSELLPTHDDWDSLRGDWRFAWWLRTLAHSSIVVILLRGRDDQRRRIKLSYEAAITPKRRWATRLGLAPYKILVDNPFIEARTYHFECKAPAGLRVEHAWLNDDVSKVPEEADTLVAGESYARSVHLYKREATLAGAGAGTVALRTGAEGFIGGAWLSAALVVIALLACREYAEKIAENPSTALTLLLVLPGLLATYIGRPDRHALATRLLSFAPWALIWAGMAAYVAAGRVALLGGTVTDADEIASRTELLETWLLLCLLPSVVALLVLTGPLVAARPFAKRLRERLRHLDWRGWREALAWLRGPHEFEVTKVVRARCEDCSPKLYGAGPSCAIRESRRDIEVPPRDALGSVTRVRPRWYGNWVLSAQVDDHEGGSTVTASGILTLKLPLQVVGRLFVTRELRRARARLAALGREHEGDAG